MRTFFGAGAGRREEGRLRGRSDKDADGGGAAVVVGFGGGGREEDWGVVGSAVSIAPGEYNFYLPGVIKRGS